jgi:hypothetical protein
MKLSPHLLQVEQAYQAMMGAASDLDPITFPRPFYNAVRPRRDLPRYRNPASVPILPPQVTPDSHVPPAICKEKLLLLAAFEATHHSSRTPISPDMVPLVIDSGASVTISPYLTDFIDVLRPVQNVAIQGIASGLQVQGIGTLQYKYYNDSGTLQTLTIHDALYVPKCTARLLCPRQLGQATGSPNDGFQCLVDKGILTYQGQITTVSYEPLSKLPVLYTAPGMETYHRFCTSAYSAKFHGSNLTKQQLRKLHMHERCAHAHWDQVNAWIRSGLLPCDPSLANEPDPVCAACQFGKMHRKSHKTNTGHIGANHTAPGMGVSSDGMKAGIPGKVFSTHGTPTTKTYRYATFWIDHFSKFVYITLHDSKRAEDLLKSKLEFEEFAARYGVNISHIRADNGAYTAKILADDCRKKQQTLSFCAVGAHWQNGVAERFIGTLVTRARTILLHAMSKWPQVVTESMWPFALRYMVNFHNASILQSKQATPFSLFTGEDPPYTLQDFRVFGSPCYVLAKRLQDGDNYQKWKSRCWLGMYIGTSNCHASSIPLIYNPMTSHITPQYHVTHDESFTSVNAQGHPAYEEVMEQLYEKATWIFQSRYDDEEALYYFSSFWTDPPPLQIPANPKKRSHCQMRIESTREALAPGPTHNLSTEPREASAPSSPNNPREAIAPASTSSSEGAPTNAIIREATAPDCPSHSEGAFSINLIREANAPVSTSPSEGAQIQRELNDDATPVILPSVSEGACLVPPPRSSPCNGISRSFMPRAFATRS